MSKEDGFQRAQLKIVMVGFILLSQLNSYSMWTSYISLQLFGRCGLQSS